jgi:hypothetical protein
MEPATYQALQERELIWVVIVKGGSIDRRRIGDILDGYFVELLLFQQLLKSLVK